jgi:hypothetical protein
VMADRMVSVGPAWLAAFRQILTYWPSTRTASDRIKGIIDLYPLVGHRSAVLGQAKVTEDEGAS